MPLVIVQRSIAGLSVALAAGGCPPVGDLGVYTASETDASGTAGVGETGVGEASAPTTSMGESTGSTTDAGESTAGLSGETEPGSTTGSTGGETGDSSGGASSEGSSGGDSSGSSSSGGVGGECGDGIVDAPEQCDDQNDDEWDGCLSDCKFGPGKQLKELDVAGKVEGELLCCMSAVADQFVEGDTHALVVGGYVPDFLPDQVAAHVQMLAIPAGGPAMWSYLEVAGMNGRTPGPMVTAANGDVIMAGQVYTEEQKVDTGGYLWLVRFAPDGQIVWSHEDTENGIKTQGIALAPGGEIVIVGDPNAFGNIPPTVQKFASDGAPLWTYHEPDSLEYSSRYGGLAIDDLGTIYVAGTQFDYDDNAIGRTILRGLSPAGALLWAEEHVAPKPRTDVLDLALTVDDVLLLTGTQYEESALEAIIVGAFDTSGGLNWWKPWTPTPGWRAHPVRLIAAPDGGAYVGGFTVNMDLDRFLVRLDAQGDELWSRVEPGDPVQDLVLAPDGFLYALSREAIAQLLP